MNRLRHFRNRRVLAGLGLVTALAAVGFWPSPVPVDTAVATRATLRVTVDEEGETRVRDRFVVSAPVAGRVLRIELEPGDAVKRGETVIATFLAGATVPLDARTRAEAEAAVEAARAALGSARAERERAQAALALARSELERHHELARQQIVSRQALEARQTETRAAEEAARAAEFATARAAHQLEMAQARLLPAGVALSGRPLALRSPIDGVVLRRLRESEAVVPAGEPLVEVGDPRRLEIVSDLLSSDAVQVRPGAQVLLEQWGGDHALRARVRRVEPSGFMKVSALGVEEQRVNVVMDFEDPLEAWSALGDGYRVEVRIVVWEGAGVLTVPTSSLFRRGDAWAVFAVRGGRAALSPVAIGRRNGVAAEVLSGLREGDSVVLHPSDALGHGTRVARRES
jgi:HlyD family secretion protein